MDISIRQNALLYIIKGVCSVLWFIDNIVIFPIQKIFRTLGISTVALINIFFVTFLMLSIRTNYLATVFSGFVQTTNAASYSLDGDVLGAAIKVPEVPFLSRDILYPKITSKSVLVMDVESGKILFEKNSDQKLAPASTTKLMTALVALDIYDLEETLAVSGECTLVESAKANLPSGEVFTVEGLVNSLLIASAGDSACVLSNSKVTYDEFVQLMNQKARSLNMKDTFFTNPVGLDAANGEHHSTARDLLRLGISSVQNPIIKDIVNTRAKNLSSIDEEFVATILNTNRLLWDIPNTVGIKTGKTEEAGEVLIYQYHKDEVNLIVVIMGSEDRFSDTKEVLDWVLTSYSWDAEAVN